MGVAGMGKYVRGGGQCAGTTVYLDKLYSNTVVLYFCGNSFFFSFLLLLVSV